ncbi:MAG: glycosyltransferase family 2 protein, partial [Brevundimonas sp.]
AARRLTSRLQPGWLRVTAWSEAPLAGDVSLIATALDAAGKVIGRAPMPLSTDRRDWLLEVPDGVNRLVLALRFAGDAQTGGVRVVLVSSAGGDLPAAGGWADRTGDLADHLRDQLARRDYAAVVAMTGAPVFQTGAAVRAGLSALVELRRFEEALRFQSAFDLGDDAGAEQRVLEALGNLGRWGEVRRRIRRTLKREPAQVRSPLLLRSFAFAAADPDLRRRVLARLAEAPEAVPPGDRAALDVAAAMAFEPGAPGDVRFIESVATDDALPAVQRYLLTSQIALGGGDLAGGDLATHWAAANRALALHDLEPLDPPAPLTPMATGLLNCAAPRSSSEGPLVTAVMTTFNSAATVTHSLSSLAAQTHGALEIIVVDDASTDDTAQRVEAFAAARPDIVLTLLRQTTNAGTYVARNRAFDQARGAYVFNQDSDDWAHPRKVERLLAAATAPGRVAAYGQGLRLSPDGRLTARRGFLAPDTSILFER